MREPEVNKPTLFQFADETRHATLGLGPTFSAADGFSGKGAMEGLKQLVAMVPERGPLEWRDVQVMAVLQVVSRTHGVSDWQIGFEESITYPKCYRAVLSHLTNGSRYRLEVLDNFAVVPSRPDLPDLLPESMYGAMLGFAAGMTEVKHLLEEAHQRGIEAPHEASKQEWRAPRFSFSLRTATGSPFVERWAFAIQESAAQKRKAFRLWIEQQRTGREIHVFRRADGSLEGEREVEALPAGVHGAAMGAVLGMKAVQDRMAKAEESGELPAVIAVRKASGSGVPKPEDRAEAEAALDEYMLTLRATQKSNN